MVIPEVVETATGEVRIGEGEVILSAGAIGSCIAVVAFDIAGRCGGIAHVMLPGRSTRVGEARPLKYAENGIGELLDGLGRLGAAAGDIRICLAGAANVLQRPDDTVCPGNIISVRTALAARGIAPCAESLGGTIRRRVRMHLPHGRVECAIGDAPFFCLWTHDLGLSS